MDALHIKRLEARYHLGRSTLSAKDRLDQLLREMLEDAVEMALEQNGISVHDELCIRRLTVPVRLRLGASDQALVAQWGYSFAEHIRQALERNDGSSVVHYRSRLHGLIDFASGVALRCYRRAWAWEQLGFVRGAYGESDAQIATQLIQAFFDEPEYIIPVFKGLVRARRLTKLLGCMPRDCWDELAKAASKVAGADPGLLDKLPTANKIDSIGATRLVRMSSIAGAVIDQASGACRGHVCLSAYSVLVALESEPGLFRSDSDVITGIVKGIESLLHAHIEGFSTEFEGKPGPFDNNPEGYSRLSPDTAHGSVADDPAVHAYGDTKHDHAEHKSQHDSNARMTNRRSSARQEQGPITPQEGLASRTFEAHPTLSDKVSKHEFSADDKSAKTPPIEYDYALPEIQASGWTTFGGLLFLIKIVEALGIPDEIIRHPTLSQHPMRWLLHQLALNLVDAEEGDPGLLAFCGLEPETTLPWGDETPLTDLEHALLLRWRGAIIEVLHKRLVRKGVSDARLLDEVCRRSARILFDPAWFEVIYSLNDVSTEYRRAALDLDPGYLPWLGIVMTFTYE